jgi:hypothetical protein
MKEVLKIAPNGQWSLEKQVREPHLPEELFEGIGQGVISHHKNMKYQGGDPRHADDVMGNTNYRGSKNKHGDLRPSVSGTGPHKLMGVTSGQSSLRERLSSKKKISNLSRLQY